MWSPKIMTLLWLSGVCEGYPCPDCFVVFFFFCIFQTRFRKEFAVSGLGMVFKFALGSVVEQPFERGMLLNKWATN